MSEPVAVPVEEVQETTRVHEDHKEVYLDDSTQNHLSYKATNGVPYIIDYFGVNDFYKTNETVTQMARELHEILVKEDSETTIAQTKETLDSLLQELNLKSNDAPFYKLKKALFLAKIKARQADLESKKLQVLADSQKLV